MKNIFLKCDDDQGKRLPDGHLVFRQYGSNGFTIKLEVPPENEAAWKFLRDIEQIIHWQGDRPLGDIEKGLSLVSNMEAYFTTWRSGPKLVPDRKQGETK